MAIATTATRAELIALAVACDKFTNMMREIEGGTGSPTVPGRYTSAEVDAHLVVLQAALTAVTA